MEYAIKSGNPEKQRGACIIAGIYESRRLSPTARAIDVASKKFITGILRRGDMNGKIGQSLLLHNVPGLLADRVLLIGCGRERDMTDSQYRSIIGNSVKQLTDTGVIEAVTYLTELNVKNRDYYWRIRQAIESVENALYQFNDYKTKKENGRRHMRKLVLTVPTRKELPAGELAIHHGKAIASGIKFTRDLANHPANVCTPSFLAEQAKHLGKNGKSIKVQVLDAVRPNSSHSNTRAEKKKQNPLSWWARA
jgi:leucyl aminopeptidase